MRARVGAIMLSLELVFLQDHKGARSMPFPVSEQEASVSPSNNLRAITRIWFTSQPGNPGIDVNAMLFLCSGAARSSNGSALHDGGDESGRCR